MKDMLGHLERSPREGYDGWAVILQDRSGPLVRTLCTTREEAREMQKRLHPDMLARSAVRKFSFDYTIY